MNKKYCLYNKQLGKEEYESELSKTSIGEINERFVEFKLKFPVNSLQNINVQNCRGDLLINSKNCIDSYVLKDSESCRYSMIGENNKNCLDCNFSDNCELQYECTNLETNYNILFGNLVRYVNDSYYLALCFNSKNCFGCTGLKGNQYCILNKQYTKQEYEELVPKIIQKMQADGERGEFFPIFMSPFAYNETVAQEYFPMTKEQVLAYKSPNPLYQGGLKRKEEEDNNFQGEMPEIFSTNTYKTDEQKKKELLNSILKCEISGRPFRIIPQELDFYIKHQLPIPTKHPDVRHAERMKLRNPRKLWNRKCMQCGKDMQTTYAPERPEIVYCEECYNAAIYGES